MDTFVVLNEIRDEQLDNFFESDKHDLQPWNTTKWKERRAEVIKEECQWCGNTDGPFHIHHTSTTPQWGREWIHASNTAFVRSDEFDVSLVSNRRECPNCGLRDYYKRKTKTPTYRCNNCKHEFCNPTTVSGANLVASDNRDTKPYTNDGFYREKALWVRENKQRVVDVLEDRFDDIMTQYMSLDETVSICQSCHFQEEKTRNTRCDECGEQFHKPNKPMCWDCLVEDKGLVECSNCGSGWYQPSKYSACSDCR